MARTWRGVIEEYRDRLPVGSATPVVTLGEGGTPLVRSEALSVETGCEVFLKYEGANPTGSFKDRGMTVAISKAVEEGAKAVVCASTGNTSASAAAYAAQGGAGLRRPRPQGQDRAREDGRDPRARRTRARGGGELRRVVRARARPGRALPGDPRELGQPLPPAGAEDVRVRDRATRSVARPTSTACRSGTPATSRATGSATPSTWPTGRSTSRRGCSGSRRAAPRRSSAVDPVEEPQTIATAIRIGNPASWDLAIAAAIGVGGRDPGGDRPRHPRRLPAGRARGAVRRAGLARRASPGCSSSRTRTRSRAAGPSSACSPVTGSRTRSGRPAGGAAPITVPAEARRRRRRARAVARARTVDRPGDVGEPRTGVRLLRARARSVQRGRRWTRTRSPA